MKLINAKKMALEEMSKWLDSSWSFAWNRRKSAFGACHYKKKEIQLSKILTESQPIAEVLDTIRHEIAHALSGPGTGHGYIWKENCRKVGANPVRAAKRIKATREDLGARWVVICPEGKIHKTYLRNPNRNTFDEIKKWYVKGRKSETLGKLNLITYTEYKRVYG